MSNDRVDIVYTHQYALPIKLIQLRLCVSNEEEMRAIYILCNRALQRERYCLALDVNDKRCMTLSINIVGKTLHFFLQITVD